MHDSQIQVFGPESGRFKNVKIPGESVLIKLSLLILKLINRSGKALSELSSRVCYGVKKFNALKQLHFKQGKNSIKELMKEVDIMRNLRHPNIVDFLGVVNPEAAPAPHQQSLMILPSGTSTAAAFHQQHLL